jgi:hypothetical protein
MTSDTAILTIQHVLHRTDNPNALVSTLFVLARCGVPITKYDREFTSPTNRWHGYQHQYAQTSWGIFTLYTVQILGGIDAMGIEVSEEPSITQ